MKQQEQILFKKASIRAIIGLGNPGSKYYKTRHSIGFRVVDALVDRYNVVISENKEMSYGQMVGIDGFASTVYLIKPLTFMNSSGVVMPWLTKKGIKPEEVIVIHDELEKPFGYVETKFGGSPKGHNGLKSIIERIGQDFWRLRVGIGRPLEKERVGDYVLEPFLSQEENSLPEIIARALEKIG